MWKSQHVATLLTFIDVGVLRSPAALSPIVALSPVTSNPLHIFFLSTTRQPEPGTTIAHSALDALLRVLVSTSWSVWTFSTPRNVLVLLAHWVLFNFSSRFVSVFVSATRLFRSTSTSLFTYYAYISLSLSCSFRTQAEVDHLWDNCFGLQAAPPALYTCLKMWLDATVSLQWLQDCCSFVRHWFFRADPL